MQKLREVFANRILELAKDDPSIMVICTDSRGSGMIGDFAKELPNQFVEAGIAEQNAVTVAAGLAAIGKRPFVVGPASFYSSRASEQVKVDVAYSKNNVKIFGISGGISYGALGATHHSVQDIAFMRAIPGLDILIPSDGKQMLYLTDELAKNNNPTYIRVGRGNVPDIYSDHDSNFQIGKAKVLREGSDLAIFVCGQLVETAIEVADKLDEAGISSSVVDVFALKPLDEETILNIASNANKVITLEEHSVYGGLGSAIAQLLSENNPKKMRIFGIPDVELPHGTDKEVFSLLGLEAEPLTKKVLDFLA